MTRTLGFAALITLAGFATGPVAETHFEEYGIVGNTTQIRVSAAMAQIEAARGTSDDIYVQGGFYDGAGAGQTTFFAVTPRDEMICIFETAPVMEGDGDVTITEAYRVELTGIYANLTSILVPNVQVRDDTGSYGFKIETAQNSQTSAAGLSFADPRRAAFTTFITANRTPCWLFG